MLISIILILHPGCMCNFGMWSIPLRACSLQFSFIEHVLQLMFLLSSGSCLVRHKADFLCDTKFYIGRALRVTNEVEIKFLHQVVETFNWPLRSNIDIVNRRRVFYGSKELKGTGHFNVPSLSYIERLCKYLQKESVCK